jgi:hypothetical protein
MSPEISPTEALGQLIAEMGITDLPVERQQSLAAAFMESYLEELTITTVALLDEEQRERVEMIIESGDAEKLHSIIAEHVPNFAEIANTIYSSGLASFKKIPHEDLM